MTESPTNPRTVVADRLEELERSQAWLGRKLRVRKQTVNGWLNGQYPFPRHRQIQCALTLGIDVSEFRQED